MSRVALDLHRSPSFIEHKKALIRVGCKKRNDRAGLEPVLLQASPTYNGLGDQDHFWQSFTSNCLIGQRTDCGHWLYNIVLGLDDFEGQPGNLVAQQLSVPWP